MTSPVSNIKTRHWIFVPLGTGLFVFAATYPVTEDQFGPQCGSLMMNEVACDELLSIVATGLGATVLLGILMGHTSGRRAAPTEWMTESPSDDMQPTADSG